MPDFDTTVLGIPVRSSDIVGRAEVIRIPNPQALFVHPLMLIELKYILNPNRDYDAWFEEAMAHVVGDAHRKLGALERRIEAMYMPFHPEPEFRYVGR